jgi:hypothetical protein
MPDLHGGDEEIRTPDLLRAKQALSQLSYTPTRAIGFYMVEMRGLEPLTSCMRSRRSPN